MEVFGRLNGFSLAADVRAFLWTLEVSHGECIMGSLSAATAILEPTASNDAVVSLISSRENPSRLVSLWDIMKAFSVGELLESIRKFRNVAALLDKSLPDIHRKQLILIFLAEVRQTKTLCEDLGLSVSSLRASQLLDAAGRLSSL